MRFMMLMIGRLMGLRVWEFEGSGVRELVGSGALDPLSPPTDELLKKALANTPNSADTPPLHPPHPVWPIQFASNCRRDNRFREGQ